MCTIKPQSKIIYNILTIVINATTEIIDAV